MNVQTPATMTASDDALQQCRSFSHSASCLMRFRSSVGIESCLIRLVCGPIDKTGMMVLDENCPPIHGEVAHAFLNGAVFIDVAFTLGLAVSISARIHRIREDVMDRGVRGSHPADRSRQGRR